MEITRRVWERPLPMATRRPARRTILGRPPRRVHLVLPLSSGNQRPAYRRTGAGAEPDTRAGNPVPGRSSDPVVRGPLVEAARVVDRSPGLRVPIACACVVKEQV